MNKICSCCGLEKNLEDFTKVSRLKFGRHIYCRSCTKLSYSERELLRKTKSKTKVVKDSRTKVCTNCGISKQHTDFKKDKRRSDGIINECKQCYNLYNKNRRISRGEIKTKEYLPEGFKRCSRCNEVKPIEVFGKCKSIKSGYISKCKKCLSELSYFRKYGTDRKYRRGVPGISKECITCGKVLELVYFHRSKRSKDGFVNKCKSCSNGHPFIPVNKVESGYKRCIKCTEVKPYVHFRPNKAFKDGYKSTCRDCCSKAYSLNKYGIVKPKQVDISSGFKRCNKCFEVKSLNKFYKSKYIKDGFKGKCIECSVAYNKEFDLRHPELKMQRYRRKYSKRRINIKYSIRDSISGRIYKSLKKGKNFYNSVYILGYSIDTLMEYLESKFTDGMSWDNYGHYVDEQGIKRLGWQIDHIIPVSKWNYRSFEDEEFKQCWSLGNLQPLWATTRVINGVEYRGNLNKSNILV